MAVNGNSPAPLNSSRPTNNFRVGTRNFSVQGMGSTPLGGDFHDSIHVDGEGNTTSKSHTTARIPGGKSIQLNWDGSSNK